MIVTLSWSRIVTPSLVRRRQSSAPALGPRTGTRARRPPRSASARAAEHRAGRGALDDRRLRSPAAGAPSASAGRASPPSVATRRSRPASRRRVRGRSPATRTTRRSLVIGQPLDEAVRDHPGHEPRHRRRRHALDRGQRADRPRTRRTRGPTARTVAAARRRSPGPPAPVAAAGGVPRSGGGPAARRPVLRHRAIRVY